ncbi:amylosucrase [Planctopirus hydrillae]|uniref:amylosucrase n=1 Tax=Planctopirus hydrillae TaxID=1841610 RepID=UPI0009F60775|nr:amylosucrase [Planctopirus hydrillae]
MSSRPEVSLPHRSKAAPLSEGELRKLKLRLIDRMQSRFGADFPDGDWDVLERRLQEQHQLLFQSFYQLYGDRFDSFYHLEELMAVVFRSVLERPAELKAFDALRESDKDWYLAPRLMGAMCYVDLFAGTLRNLEAKIPYLIELGITYLHLMPIYKVHSTDCDGGYAVSDYRTINPRFGTMEDLEHLATQLRRHGISLVLDFVFNHTSDEHEWAQRALKGERDYQDFYLFFKDRVLPDQYERTLVEVFPEEHPGAFTYQTALGQWVWTTFYTSQWDLNYRNPEVLVRMLDELLFLANRGVEIVRLDAIAFIWKELGTNCQNLPQAHTIVSVLNAATQIAAPAVVFKSEAIVHPDEVRTYINRAECVLSYNPELMALLWESLATRNIRTLLASVRKRFPLPDGCVWVNYIRSHDDIGWSITDEEIREAGYDPIAHRRFLTQFYTGRVEGSFAEGVPFQENSSTGDARVSGTCASLAGLGKAIRNQDRVEIDFAIGRVLLLYGVVMTIGGIPLIYLGDEIGSLNDASYLDDPLRKADSRWIHRPKFPWEQMQEVADHDTPAARIHDGILKLGIIRRQNLALRPGKTEFVGTGNDHVLGYFRTHAQASVLILANFTEKVEVVEGRILRGLGLRRTVIDQVSGMTISSGTTLELQPYQFMILDRQGSR